MVLVDIMYTCCSRITYFLAQEDCGKCESEISLWKSCCFVHEREQKMIARDDSSRNELLCGKQCKQGQRHGEIHCVRLTCLTSIDIRLFFKCSQ